MQSNYQVPSGGKIYEKKMEFEEGDTVMDVLKRTGVDIDVSKGYVAGIDGLYEFDCGKNSGWMYRVNGKFPNYMAGKCKLHDGDKVEWLYTCVRGSVDDQGIKKSPSVRCIYLFCRIVFDGFI